MIKSTGRHLHFTPDGVQGMNVRPLHDRIIVQRLEEGEQKVGGIIIPDTAKEKPSRAKSSRPEAAKSKTTESARRSM